MAEAKLNREYALRILGVGAVMFGMCVWSLYDGHIGWPKVNRAMEHVRPALLATNLTAEVWLSRDGDNGLSPLEEAFRAAGEKAPSKLIKHISEIRIPEQSGDDAALKERQKQQLQKIFEGPVYSSHDLQAQTVQALITFFLGAWAWGSLALKAGKRFCADDTGLHGSGFGKEPIPFASISKIDWSAWEEKGILVLTFGNGARIKLDGWHFSDMRAVVDVVKSRRPDLAEKGKKA